MRSARLKSDGVLRYEQVLNLIKGLDNCGELHLNAGRDGGRESSKHMQHAPRHQ